MIDQYNFVDANSDGKKEKVTTTVTEPYNKLSALETNNFKDKINEVISIVNTLVAPLFPNLILKYKAVGNLDQFNLQVGDIAGRFNGDYYYLGGDVSDIANFDLIPKVIPIPKRYAGSGQDYTIPDGVTATIAFIDGYPQYLEDPLFLADLNTFTQTGNVVTFKTIIETNSQIII